MLETTSRWLVAPRDREGVQQRDVLKRELGIGRPARLPD
jgi:hypothetical protein